MSRPTSFRSHHSRVDHPGRLSSHDMLGPVLTHQISGYVATLTGRTISWSGWLRSCRSANSVTGYLHDPTFRMRNGISSRSSSRSRIHTIHCHSILSFCYLCTNFNFCCIYQTFGVHIKLLL
ncbi:hypothetical protein HanXRQr2_Chr14g0632871 [Helianthus annuus]|uniref:Uncharacterized protein n=1 Tax=Helianthus annuus TaxID=4232 RepID=A0A9K3E748_HELAN|nr:hypothetical protein HanXRQr2_Chr14g0632871 [Helianthus annuus]KAJ0839450.1 hypothetical protein HanPSC8_Chr14g0606971 [Helianthus annuus]